MPESGAEVEGPDAMRLYRHDDPQHVHAAERLTWLIDGTLLPDAAARIERHVSDCIACAQELARLRSLRTLQRQTEADSRLSRALARAQARIDEMEAIPAPPPSGNRVAAGWAALPAWARTTLLVQAALALGLSGLLLYREPPRYYRTQSEVVLPLAERSQLVAKFDATHPEREIRAVLLAADARIVDGPSPAGLYMLDVKAEDEERVLALLRGSRAIVLAEPAYPPAR
jgi:hypothetical protein